MRLLPAIILLLAACNVSAVTIDTLSVPGSGSEGDFLSFSATASGPGALTFGWDFGDGATGSGSVASHVYSDNGTYTVSLTVTNDALATATQSATISIINVDPIVDTLVVPAIVNAGELFTVSSTASDVSPDDTSAGITYGWAFGDGSFGSGGSTTGVYSAAGTYTGSLTVSDKDGGSAIQSFTITALEVSVPTPSMGLLFMLGLVGLRAIHSNK
jgi:PKD repeat protein